MSTKLTIRKSEDMGDWYVIERAEHDGREWFEQTGPSSMALRCSARISDADVEGGSDEMRLIGFAIENRDCVSFRRCAVDATREPVTFWSPRNSQTRGEVTRADADELAAQIRRELPAATVAQERA